MNKTVGNADAGKKQVGERIKAVRKGLALNQSNFAKLVGVSPQAAAQWEAGEFLPRGDNLAKLCEVLKAQPQYILFGIDTTAQSSAEVITNVKELLHSAVFKQAFHQAIEEMIQQTSDMEWISCENKAHIPAMADIALLKLKQNKTLG
ncbi:MAG: transcriptional regulator with XRE-family HTH domain [Alteromonadaceae bacterium]|jgi:transcriptional regulator with XRE-family HTH domain